MHLSQKTRETKLRALSAAKGFGSTFELLGFATFSEQSPAICTNLICDFTTETEPDQEHGHCELCGGNTVASALILAGPISAGACL